MTTIPEQEMFCCALVKANGPKVKWLHTTCHDYWDRLQAAEAAKVGRTDTSIEALELAAQLREENQRLRARVVMLLRCHYDEHKHIGTPTCFDVQSPADEWEDDARTGLVATREDDDVVSWDRPKRTGGLKL